MQKNNLVFEGAVKYFCLAVLTFALENNVSVGLEINKKLIFTKTTATLSDINTSETENYGIKINNDEANTSSPQVTISLFGKPDTTWVEISEDPAFGEKRRLNFDTNYKINHTPHEFPNAPGLKTIYARFCNTEDVCSDIYSDGIILVPNNDTTQPYDTNQDNRIDLNEFNALVANWGTQNKINPSDYDAGGRVDIFDFNQLMVHWTI